MFQQQHSGLCLWLWLLWWLWLSWRWHNLDKFFILSFVIVSFLMAVAGLLLNNWNSFVILVLRPVNIHRSKISIIQKLIISPTALPLTFTNQDAIFSKAHSFGHEAMHELIIATTSIKLHQEIALTITKLKQKTRSNTKPLEKTDKLVKLFIFTLTDDK